MLALGNVLVRWSLLKLTVGTVVLARPECLLTTNRITQAGVKISKGICDTLREAALTVASELF
jgi:hypothetical protein